MKAMKEVTFRKFANGVVYALETDDGYPIEVTDTHLPYYTKDAIGRKQNGLETADFGDRSERWMIGVSTMSGCPVGCKFCSTGKLKRWRKLTAEEIVAQVEYILAQHPELKFTDAKEHKINYTRMGEPFLNLEEVKRAINRGMLAWYPSLRQHDWSEGIRFLVDQGQHHASGIASFPGRGA